MSATKESAVEWVGLFIKHGIDFNKRFCYGINVTNMLVALGFTEAALMVLTDKDVGIDGKRSKVDLTVCDDRGRSILFYAAYSKDDYGCRAKCTYPKRDEKLPKLPESLLGFLLEKTAGKTVPRADSRHAAAERRAAGWRAVMVRSSSRKGAPPASSTLARVGSSSYAPRR